MKYAYPYTVNTNISIITNRDIGRQINMGINKNKLEYKVHTEINTKTIIKIPARAGILDSTRYH